MKHRSSLLLALFGLFSVVVFASSGLAAAKPNILLILADDLGYHDLGFQGSTRVKTPHLDKLASTGMRFTDGHVSASVCSPSRAGLITGRYQQRFGHEANCPPRPNGMDVDERTLGQALQALGYRTACIGKWHLGDEPEHYPNKRGFDEFWGLREGSRSFWCTPGKGSDKPGNPHGIEHNGEQVFFEGHLTDRLTDRAIEYIQADSLKPFFIFLSHTAPHGPLQPKPEDQEAVESKDPYLGLVYGMDRNIGRVIDVLEQTGKLDNTMIWFLSDNGGTTGKASNYPLGGKKGTKFEGGHRVPFILNWKGKVPAGVYDPMVSALDIYPTCVKAAGGSLKQPRPLDGVDLMPYVTGTVNGVPHEQLFWRKLECAAVRDSDWKLIRVENHGLALFDLSKDIEERKDLAATMPEKADQLRAQLEAWEADKIQSIWKEGKVWTGVRFKDHTVKYETGLLPGRKPGSRTLK